MFRIALVGSGGMARHYREVYSAIPGARWALAVDRDEKVLQECLALGAERVSTRFEDALAPEIDMVDISTPNHLHADQAVAAISAGKHVLIQKPIANTLADADRIVAAALQSNRTIGMFMSSYGQPAYWEMKRIIDMGVLGQIQSVRARDAHRGGLTARKVETNWRASREMTGGGAFIQLTIHAINLMQWLLGARITDVCGFAANQYCESIGGDDVAVVSARFADGRYFGTFDCGYASDGMMREVYGTRGRMMFNENNGQLDLVLDEPYHSEYCNYDKPHTRMSFAIYPPKINDVESRYNQHRQFVEAAMAGKPAPVTVEVGRYDLAVVKAVYESAETGRVVRVAGA